MQVKDFASGVTHVTCRSGGTERASYSRGTYGEVVTLIASDGVRDALRPTQWSTLDQLLASYRPATADEIAAFEARYQPAPVNYL